MGRTRNVILTIVVVGLAYQFGSPQKQKPESPLVTTNYGDLKGIVSVSRDGREFYEFLGIQYAKSERFEVNWNIILLCYLPKKLSILVN